MAQGDNNIEFNVRVKGGEGLGDVAQSLGEVEAELKGVGKESSTAGTALGEMARQQRLIDSFVRIKQETVAAGAAFEAAQAKAQQLERMGREKNLEQAPAALRELQQELAALREAFGQYC